MRSYKFKLKVCDTFGRRFDAKIKQLDNGQNRIETSFHEAIKKDNPKNSKDGKMVFFYDRKLHSEIIKKLENYLESLMLKELAKNDNTNTSESNGTKSRRVKKSTEPKPIKPSEGKKPGSLHDSGAGDEQTKGDK